MNKVFPLLLLSIPLIIQSGCVVTPSQPRPRVVVGATVVNDDVDSFYISLSEYFQIPKRDVIYIHDRRIPDHEIPVVLFIAQRAHLAPALIVNLRLSGNSWMDISLRFGLGPEIFYVPVQRVYGAPYGHAYGHYQNRNRNDWNGIRLADDDMVNLVNLRFISDRYRFPPEEVMRMRSSGRNFVYIHDEVRRSNKTGEYRPMDRGDVRDPGKQQERWEMENRQRDRKEVREPVLPPDRREMDSRQPDRKDVREPVKQPEWREMENRQWDRKEVREPAQPPDRREMDTRQPDRKDAREPEKQLDRTGMDSRQADRKATRDPIQQQDRLETDGRQPDRKDVREPMKQPDRSEINTRQPDRKGFHDPMPQPERREIEARQRDSKVAIEPAKQSERREEEIRPGDARSARGSVRQPPEIAGPQQERNEMRESGNPAVKPGRGARGKAAGEDEASQERPDQDGKDARRKDGDQTR